MEKKNYFVPIQDFTLSQDLDLLNGAGLPDTWYIFSS